MFYSGVSLTKVRGKVGITVARLLERVAPKRPAAASVKRRAVKRRRA
jgi:hypothetical protein